ncbi:hypothetical protein BC826DRAFT_968475 [Russula brevipes]|nr:hypothetical protein BC826DRAFT_968475 [Russula brevipes]
MTELCVDAERQNVEGPNPLLESEVRIKMVPTEAGISIRGHPPTLCENQRDAWEIRTGRDKCAKDLATEGMNRWVKRSLGRMRYGGDGIFRPGKLEALFGSRPQYGTTTMPVLPVHRLPLLQWTTIHRVRVHVYVIEDMSPKQVDDGNENDVRTGYLRKLSQDKPPSGQP